MPIYEVQVIVPAHNEVLTTAAESEAQAKEIAVTSASQRVRESVIVTVREVPAGAP